MTSRFHRRADHLLDRASDATPHLAGPILLARCVADRARTGGHDSERGASTVEVIIWSGIGLAVALGVGALLFTAIRNRAGTIGRQIQDDPLPNGGA